MVERTSEAPSLPPTKREKTQVQVRPKADKKQEQPSLKEKEVVKTEPKKQQFKESKEEEKRTYQGKQETPKDTQKEYEKFLPQAHQDYMATVREEGKGKGQESLRQQSVKVQNSPLQTRVRSDKGSLVAHNPVKLKHAKKFS